MTTSSDAVPGWFRKQRNDETDSDKDEHAGSPGEASMTATGGGLETEPAIVWEAANRMEAQIVRGRLESEGIPAILQGEAVGDIYGITTGNLARTFVLVPAPLAERALEILESEVDWSEWEDEAHDEGDPHG